MEYYNYDSSRISGRMHPPVVVRFSGWHRCRPCHSYGPAKRDHYLLHYVTGGRGVYQVNGKTYSLAAGDGFIIYPYDVTFYQADQQDPWEYSWIAWNGDYAQEILNHFAFTEQNLLFHKDDVQEVSRLFQDVFKTYESDYNPYSLLGRFYSLMAAFVGDVGAEDVILNRAVTYIHNGYRSIRSINEIADYVFMSRSHLYRLFMDAFGKSPKKYLDDFRLKKARQLLEDTERHIDDIALESGYNSVSHFSNTFKNCVGMSPSQYRILRKSKLGNLNIRP